MKLKASCKMQSTLKKTFTELEIPDTEFKGMKEGDKKLFIDKHKDKIILEIYKGKKWASFITGYQSFGER